MPKWRADYFVDKSNDLLDRYAIINASSEESALEIAEIMKGDADHFSLAAICNDSVGSSD